MGLIKSLMDKVKKFNMFDFTVFKTYVVLIGMIIGAYLAVFVKTYVWWFVAAIVLCLIWILYKMSK